MEDIGLNKDVCGEYKIDIHKFVEEHYKPVEDKPGYVWFNPRNMQIISIDTLVEAYETYLRTALYTESER